MKLAMVSLMEEISALRGEVAALRGFEIIVDKSKATSEGSEINQRSTPKPNNEPDTGPPIC
jgi:hypothetical protein